MLSLARRFCSSSSRDTVSKAVLISQSTDIFYNLALEDWLYKREGFDQRPTLLIWRNDPCVVIGRHQNPWQEADVSFLSERGIPLARRNSGGGTVYHDRGNLNLTFFTSKRDYDRKRNLAIIARALFREYAINATVNPRDDIVVRDKYKISGTAAKLGRTSAYHHCTLLVNSDKFNLKKALTKKECGIQSKATPSVSSPVANLAEENGRITIDGLQAAVGWEYLRTPASHLADGGLELIAKQHGFQMVNPTEYWFPGIEKIRDDLASWDWRFGKTPDFSVSRTVTVPSKLFKKDQVNAPVLEDDVEFHIDMSVEKGRIAEVSLNIPPGLCGYHGNASVETHLKGEPFTPEAVGTLHAALQSTHSEDKNRSKAIRADQVVTTM